MLPVDGARETVSGFAGLHCRHVAVRGNAECPPSLDSLGKLWMKLENVEYSVHLTRLELSLPVLPTSLASRETHFLQPVST